MSTCFENFCLTLSDLYLIVTSVPIASHATFQYGTMVSCDSQLWDYIYEHEDIEARQLMIGLQRVHELVASEWQKSVDLKHLVHGILRLQFPGVLTLGVSDSNASVFSI